MKNKAKSASGYSRRNFLKTAGSITIGFTLLEGCEYPLRETEKSSTLPGSLDRYPRINAWLELLADGRIRVLTGKMELGQGIRIAVAQMAAEELDIDLEKVEVNLAETGRTPDEGYTAGSRSIESSAIAVRYAAAAARGKLLELASAKTGLSTEELIFSNGIIRSKDRQLELTLADLLKGKQIEDEVQMPVQLKPKEKYRYVGKQVPRDDMDSMV